MTREHDVEPCSVANEASAIGPDAAYALAEQAPTFGLETPDPPPIAPQQGPRPGESATGHERSADDVFRDHLKEGKHGSVERDLPRNYAHDLVVLTREGAVHGWDGMRTMAQKLRKELPNARFTYTAKPVCGRIALLEWTAESPNGAYVDDGVDSYVIEGGQIVAQTIHYTVRVRAGG